MKKRFSFRTLGIFLIILSSLGLLFSLAAIAVSWIIKPDIQQSLLSMSDTLESILVNTDEGLFVLDKALDNTVSNLDIVSTTFENLDGTIVGIESSLDSSATLVGDDLRQTILETQIALSSAATSAKLIDDTLAIIAAIPFLGTKYQPEVPLHTSLETVSGSMDDIPTSLESMEESLITTSEGFGLLNENLQDLSEDLTNFKGDLEDAQEVLSEYRRIIIDTEEKLVTFRDNLPINLTLLAIFISGILFSLAVAQCITLLQGIGYIEGEKQAVNLADIRRE